MLIGLQELTMKPKEFDVVVVGSGPAGVHAAYPLIKAGLNVAMIDGGGENPNQGKEQRTSVFKKTHALLKIKSNIEIVQILAKGGLSEVWHGICDFFSENELEAIGLPPREIRREYKEISRLIKLSARTPLDLHSKLLLAKARLNTHRENSIYKVPLVFSYRTSAFVEKLKRFKNFTYIPNQLVYKVKENRSHIEIQSYSIDKKYQSTTKASILILAAGAINTTRIVLRSFNLYNHKTNFLTKANYIVPCLHLESLGKKNDSRESDFGQLVIKSKGTDRGVDSFFIQLYRLNRLFLHKALQYIFLPKMFALPLLSALAPYIVIADIRFPAFESKEAFCKLKKGTNKKDTLEISFKEENDRLIAHREKYNKIRKQLWSLGLIPLKIIFGYTTSHYAGGVSVNKNGKLNKTNKIYIADSSSWKILPAKPPTITIMANAARVGKNVLREFLGEKI